MTKGYKWSLRTLLRSWAVLLGIVVMVNMAASYVEVMAVQYMNYKEVSATHTLSWWNFFNVFTR